MKKITMVVLSALAMIPGQAMASTTGNGLITNIVVLAGGQVLFNFIGDRSATPACHTIPGRWAFDGTTVVGQERLAVLLTAHASDKQILIIGNGNCDVWGDTESVSYFQTSD